MNYFQNTNLQSDWILKVKTAFYKYDVYNIWESHTFPNARWLYESVIQKLFDLYIIALRNMISRSCKCITYRLLKKTLVLKTILSKPIQSFCFICSNLELKITGPVESGFWTNTDFGDRKCNICSQNEIDDEFH